MHGPQVRRHVVLPVELLRADGARVGLAVQVGGDVVAVEVGRVGVGVVAHLAAVGVALLHAEAPDADRVALLGSLGRRGGGGGGRGCLGRAVQRRQFRLGLKLKGGQVAAPGGVRRIHRGRRGQQGGRRRHAAAAAAGTAVLLGGGGGRRGGRVAESPESVGQSLLPKLLHVDGILHLGRGGLPSFLPLFPVMMVVVVEPVGHRPLVEAGGGAPGHPVFFLQAEVLRLRLHHHPALGGGVWQLEPLRRGVGGDGGAAVAAVLVLTGPGAVVPVHVEALFRHLPDVHGSGVAASSVAATGCGGGRGRGRAVLGRRVLS